MFAGLTAFASLCAGVVVGGAKPRRTPLVWAVGAVVFALVFGLGWEWLPDAANASLGVGP
jgi:hypothetical protein